MDTLSRGRALLNDEQKREAALIASVGCDRETAAKYVGCAAEALADAAQSDPGFADALRRAEAGCEVAHMRNIQQAAREERNWRASVWWLERRLPERYARREAGAVGRRELLRFLSAVASGLAAAIHSDDDRRRVLDKLQQIGESLADPLLPGDADPDEPTPPDCE